MLGSITQGGVLAGGGGPQTASMVGPKGSEIHTDQFGRIKVQFHWDRHGKHDEQSSCWVRVSQPWAGQGLGTDEYPRPEDMVTTVQNYHNTLVHGPQQLNIVTKGRQFNYVKQNIDSVSESGYIHLTASTELVLKVGDSQITMKADGSIEIKGTLVNVSGSNSINLNT